MNTVKIKFGDGYEWYDNTSSLDAALACIKETALNVAFDTWSGDLDKVFPAYYQVIDNGKGLIASGFVDAAGNI